MDPTENFKGDNPLKQIRTFQGDVAEALRRQNESLVSIQQREQAKRSPVPSPVPPKPEPRPEPALKQPLQPAPQSAPRPNFQPQPETKPAPQHQPEPKPEPRPRPVIIESDRQSGGGFKMFLYFLGGVMLIGLSGLGGWYAYTQFMDQRVAPPIAAPESRLVSPTSERELEISGATGRLSLMDSIRQNLADTNSGELRHLVIRETAGIGSPRIIGTERFFSILESRAPGSLVRAFGPAFMLGSLGRTGMDGGANPSVFMIIELSSFENAFAGMLLWERSMAEDIGPFFGTAERLRTTGLEPTFRDITTRNKDARILEIGGEITLLYSFYDNELLIITDDIETLRSLIERLNREKLSR